MARSTSTLKTMRAVSRFSSWQSQVWSLVGLKRDEALEHLDRLGTNSVGACPASPAPKFHSPR